MVVHPLTTSLIIDLIDLNNVANKFVQQESKHQLRVFT